MSALAVRSLLTTVRSGKTEFPYAETLNAAGCGTAEIMRRSGKSKPVVWRWQARMAEDVDGLTHDKTRKPGQQPLPATVVQRVVDLTLGPPPGDATHWTGRMLAKAAGVSLRSAHAVVLSVDEKSEIQALDRTQPGLPICNRRSAFCSKAAWR
jgi:hypothetical protein